MRIDHLVWYGAGLEAGRSFFAARLDKAPAYGGSHPGEGTANHLSALGPDTYLEILGRDPGQPDARLDPEVAALEGEGLYHWAVGGIAIADLKARAEAAGLAHGIAAGGRAKPDGTKLAWTFFGVRGHGFGALIPFFIDWHDTPHPARAAPRGGSLVEFTVMSPQAARLQAIYDALGIDVSVREGPEPGFAATIQAAARPLALRSLAPLPHGYVI